MNTQMSGNRFLNLFVAFALLVVAALLIREAMNTTAVVSNLNTAMRPYTAGSMEAESEGNELDSATRSYIAWGEALQAAGKLGDSGACSNPTQENIFAGIPNNLDSATRSYIAWGLALQAKDDIRACR